MRYLMTEEEAAYMEMYQGHFSRKLASWAISNMQAEDPATGKVKNIPVVPVDDVMEILKSNDIKIPYESKFDAWYLYMMCLNDYAESLDTDKRRAKYIEETICDIDGEPTSLAAYNPNNSVQAIEGIFSPDGRVFGKMGHSERIGRNLYKNVPGERDQKLFESGTAYFR